MATTESNSVTEGTAVDENAAAGAGDIQDSRSADAPRGIPKACVFVANLRAETDEAIIELFQTYGPILRVKTHRDPSSTRTFAFIQYHSIADADAAIEQTNGKTFWGRPLRVERAKVQRTLFLAKLPKSMSEADLREIVQTFGPVEKVTIIINHQTQQSKGCGFVKFEFREDAIAAVEGLRNSRRRWIVEWSTSTHDLETPPPDKHAIFIGNLPASATKESVEARFSVYGTIDNITFVQRQPRSDGEGGPDSPTSSPAGADHDAVSPGPDHPSAAAPAAGSPGSPPLAAAPGSPSSSSSSSSAAAAAVSGSASAAAGGAAGSDESGGAGRRISPAFAFVRFADAAAAAAAIDQQDGAVWEQCRLRCESADSKTSKRNKAAQRLMAPPGHQQFRRQPGFPYPRGGPGGKFDRSGDHPPRYHQDPRGAPHYHSDPAAGTQYDHRRGQRAGYPPRSHHSGSSGPRHSGSSSGGPGQPPPNYHPWPKAPASRASYQHYWSPRSYPPGYIFPTSIGVYPSPAPPPPGGNVKYAYHPSSPPPKKQDPPADAADPAAAAAAAAAAPRGSFFPPPAFSVEPYDSSQPWPNYPRNPPHSRRHYSPESDASQGKW